MKPTSPKNTVRLCAAIAALLAAATASAAPLLNFQFNEGTGVQTTDAINSVVGRFGIHQNPLVDTVTLMDASPSGLPGDRCFTNSGSGFLLVDDAVSPVLNITNGPITIETWIYVDFATVPKTAEGIAGYGSSYKLGMRGGYQVFTLFGISDITNTAAGQIPAGQWVHLAAAWEPGVGVHFFVNGIEHLEPHTALAARPVANYYLGIGSEGFANSAVAAYDRLRIHNALLTAAELDTDPLVPKAPLASTRVAYNFNEAAFPCQSAVAPSRPTLTSASYLPTLANPVWTNDTPTGLAGDFALAFNQSQTNQVFRDRVPAEYGAASVDLGANNTNYTLQAWVKLPSRLINDRMVIYRTDGPAPRVALSIAANRTLHTTVFGNTDFASSVLVPNDDRWHHIAAVMENNFGRIRFYLDGISRQTVNRTATGAASAGTVPAQLLIGLESETRYFRGLLDRVVVNNDALPASGLDFPAIPGLPVITAQPADFVVDAGSTATFTATVTSATAASYQWWYRTNLLDHDGIIVTGATTPTLQVPNATLANEGYYYLRINNDTGTSESYGARLTVRTSPGKLQRLWQILPGERAYITGYSNNAVYRDLERSMAYNPSTGHLLIGARNDSTGPIKGIYILDAQTGAHLGELKNPGIISGGTIVMTRVVVAEDGAIFACNFGSLTDANPLKIYRWASEDADPTIAYQGNPVSGIVANQQWGKNMAIRGAGVNTRILMDTRTTVLALFTTSDGETFTPTLIQADARSDDWNNGLAWLDDNRVWGKNATDPLYEWYVNPATNGAALLRTVPGLPRDGLGNFGFSSDGKYLAGLLVQPGPDAVDLYDVSDPGRPPVLVDTGLFTSDQTQTVGYGNVVIVNNRVFALNPNNGVVAFAITTTGPKLGIRTDPGGVALYWPAAETGFILESTPSLPAGTWTTVPTSVVGDERVAIEPLSGAPKFYRLRSSP